MCSGYISKYGSSLLSNLIQCCHSLGQQIVAESRLPLGDYDRVFPHDRKWDDRNHCIESRGLLWDECFIQGLSPLAFFVHAIAGREALVEGATSTAQSGYSMRLGNRPRFIQMWPVASEGNGIHYHGVRLHRSARQTGGAIPVQRNRYGSQASSSFAHVWVNLIQSLLGESGCICGFARCASHMDWKSLTSLRLPYCL